MEEDRLSTLDQLDQLEEIFLDGNRIPFSGNRLVNEQDAIELLDEIRESIPRAIVQATDLIKNSEKYINQSKKNAEDILTKAKQERSKMVDSVAVKQEAERQISELQNYTRQKCDNLLKASQQKAAQIENQTKQRISQLEIAYNIKRQKLEEESIKRKKQLELEDIELNKNLKKRFENNNRKAIEHIEALRNEGLQIKNLSLKEAERINKESIQFRQKTQQQCEALISQSRNEAAYIQDGANKYAEQTLQGLENRLQELNQIVLAGRNELTKIQSISSIRKQNSSNKDNKKSIPFRRIRDHASTIKNAINSTG